eukprot:2527174-Rhodomonas_salina.1
MESTCSIVSNSSFDCSQGRSYPDMWQSDRIRNEKNFCSMQCPDANLKLKIGDVLLVTATITVETGCICNNSQV